MCHCLLESVGSVNAISSNAKMSEFCFFIKSICWENDLYCCLFDFFFDIPVPHVKGRKLYTLKFITLIFISSGGASATAGGGGGSTAAAAVTACGGTAGSAAGGTAGSAAGGTAAAGGGASATAGGGGGSTATAAVTACGGTAGSAATAGTAGGPTVNSAYIPLWSDIFFFNKSINLILCNFTFEDLYQIASGVLSPFSGSLVLQRVPLPPGQYSLANVKPFCFKYLNGAVFQAVIILLFHFSFFKKASCFGGIVFESK